MEVKIAVIGSGGVGKSCLTLRFTQETFSENYDPTIEDSYYKFTELENSQQCGFSILDTAGQEEFKSLRESWMKHADGFLLVYSMDDKKSFESILEFYEQILRVKDTDSWPAIVVVGNKADLEDSRRQVTADMVTKFIKQYDLDHFDCSALSGLNVKKAFQRTAKYVLIHKGVKLLEEVVHTPQNSEVNISISAPPDNCHDDNACHQKDILSTSNSHGKLSSLDGGGGSSPSLWRRTTSDAPSSNLNSQIDASPTTPSFISNSNHSGKSLGSYTPEPKSSEKKMKCVIL
ncbi:hypothetical protein C9374_011138 [Naegleria lovaniensis]|uniref:Ras family small GTPase n=1 Tax=Naegleria lovaniensis TaxID=51637 RepID=A0AA88KEX4_NAELO|nr:uncharacterized protein C9374_011138 [Naegleria lovaniensis]KAG2374059.1 hypothetical protein C9374_011138 [Naegleria lovaniensis]